MYVLKGPSGIVATSDDPITYDAQQMGWQCGGTVYVDAGRSYSVLRPLSPPEFKLLFRAAERVQITARRAVDPLLNEQFSILDDPRLTQVVLVLPEVVQGVESLLLPFTPASGSAIPAILTAARVNDILNGNQPSTTPEPA